MLYGLLGLDISGALMVASVYLLTLPASAMAPLLVFVDNLTLLLILQKWGQRNYNPEPRDIVHFDVIEQLLKALRQWPFQVRLVKIPAVSLMSVVMNKSK